MSPFAKLVVLDNNCICNFFVAKCLDLVLSLWAYRVFVIPRRVFNEAGNWREHGAEVCRIINDQSKKGVIAIIELNEADEDETNAYMNLRLAGPILGEGESESMAMALRRGYIVATDDRIATEQCKIVFPSVQVVTTGDILKMAKSDGLLTARQIEDIWRQIKFKRP